jgi:hypothetical protein
MDQLYSCTKGNGGVESATKRLTWDWFQKVVTVCPKALKREFRNMVRLLDPKTFPGLTVFET